MPPQRRTKRVNSGKAAAQRVEKENWGGAHSGGDDYEEDDNMVKQVSDTASQGCPCPRSGVFMPEWLSETDSSVPVGDHQTFSASDHRPPWWIGLLCILSLLLYTAVHYNGCDSKRQEEENKGRQREYT
ncbi:hypothetical protein PBY51_015100 [Eleginops maclovinus]|uniref:Uncharacterized protein n=1 Tax=Eleginops maclovinus TaxID=56733 RepID=A0AAN7X478_ELEMC|nr:hypothetical protein PBY51_015100 [Eleginops maclovinus]